MEKELVRQVVRQVDLQIAAQIDKEKPRKNWKALTGFDGVSTEALRAKYEKLKGKKRKCV